MKYRDRIEKIRSLKNEGFKMIKNYPDLYICPTGRIFNLSKGKWESLVRERLTVIVNGRRLSVPKLLLQTFANQPYLTHRHVKFLDGNRLNLDVINLKYSNGAINVDGERLLKAIRCYFEVAKRYKVRDIFRTKIYLQSIVNSRLFIVRHSKDSYIGLFAAYLEKVTVTRNEMAEKYNITIRDCHNIVNGYINQLIDEVLRDLDAGFFEMKGFQARKLTYRDFKKFLAELKQEKPN